MNSLDFCPAWSSGNGIIRNGKSNRTDERKRSVPEAPCIVYFPRPYFTSKLVSGPQRFSGSDGGSGHKKTAVANGGESKTEAGLNLRLLFFQNRTTVQASASKGDEVTLVHTLFFDVDC